jgi:hypothetical protein
LTFAYDSVETENKNKEVLECQLVTTSWSQDKLEDNFQKLIPFLHYMISSFKDGLCGMFRTEEYRRMVTKTFPINIYMGVEQYIVYRVYLYISGSLFWVIVWYCS